MYAATMFVAGFIGNLLCQSVRSLLNVALGAARLALAALALLLGSLMILGGGREKGRSSCSSAWRRIKDSTTTLMKGLAQGCGAATLATPMLRGAQASSEEFRMQSLYSPNSPNATPIQRVFGLNSWDPPIETKKDKREPTRTTAKTTRKDTRTATPRKRVAQTEWESLARRYLESRTAKEADGVRLAMAKRHPILYVKALKLAGSRTKSR